MRVPDFETPSSPTSFLIVLLLLSTTFACSPAARQRAASSLNAAAVGAASGSAAPRSQKIMLFGGENHRTYLGCLSCSEYATDSVFNQYGTYGSRYSSTSIWNHYGQFGSAYSSYSSCSQYATDPPVIVDVDGNYYGRLTINSYHPQIAAGAKFSDWLKTAVCEE
jgi:hypothetical protein